MAQQRQVKGAPAGKGGEFKSNEHGEAGNALAVDSEPRWADSLPQRTDEENIRYAAKDALYDARSTIIGDSFTDRQEQKRLRESAQEAARASMELSRGGDLSLASREAAVTAAVDKNFPKDTTDHRVRRAARVAAHGAAQNAALGESMIIRGLAGHLTKKHADNNSALDAGLEERVNSDIGRRTVDASVRVAIRAAGRGEEIDVDECVRQGEERSTIDNSFVSDADREHIARIARAAVEDVPAEYESLRKMRG